MKNVSAIVFLIFFSFTAISNEYCFDAFNVYFKYNTNPKVIAADLLLARQKSGLPIVLDIGGEGRYLGALNLNPQPLTSTTGVAERIIPNWVPGIGDDIPFPNKIFDLVIIENAPVGKRTLYEINRVGKSGAKVKLSHPTDYADSYYERVTSYFGAENVKRVDDGIISKITITIP